MDFKETQAIYLQIVDLVCDHIVTGKWKAQERIPSVRELGVQLEVNPNICRPGRSFATSGESAFL